MEENVLDSQESKPQRPVFLTVICILSFIGIGLAVLGYIGAIAMASIASTAMANLDAMAAEYGGTSTYTGPSAGMIWAYVGVGFLTTIVALLGVIKMWNLKKQGFMLYTGAQVVAILMTVVAGFFSIASVIFPAAFIIMYGLNLKHMK
ncbi:MAG: hypothetical protein ACK4K0_03110 [Flavobacteriales bacterium]